MAHVQTIQTMVTFLISRERATFTRSNSTLRSSVAWPKPNPFENKKKKNIERRYFLAAQAVSTTCLQSVYLDNESSRRTLSRSLCGGTEKEPERGVRLIQRFDCLPRLERHALHTKLRPLSHADVHSLGVDGDERSVVHTHKPPRLLLSRSR